MPPVRSEIANGTCYYNVVTHLSIEQADHFLTSVTWWWTSAFSLTRPGDAYAKLNCFKFLTIFDIETVLITKLNCYI